MQIVCNGSKWLLYCTTHTQNDLRSAIVKEACILLEKLSTASGNYMAAFMRDMLNVLLHLMANGNSVRMGTRLCG